MLVYRALAFRQSESRNFELCVVYGMSSGTVPIWKMNFCSEVFLVSVLPRCREMPQTAMCLYEWLGRLKCRASS